MPIYVYECDKCGNQTEHILSIHADPQMNCHKCVGGVERRIIVASGQYLGNQDAPWIRSVLEVVDKDSRKPHVREFIKNPTRSNYKAWMKGEGLRPMDSTVNGAPPVYRKPEGPDRAQIRKQIIEKHIARRRIEI